MLPIGHTNAVSAAVSSPDGMHVLTASADKTAKLWDKENGYLLQDLRGHTERLTSIVYSPNGKQALTASNDGTARIWDLQSGKTLLILKGHRDAVRAARYSPDGRLIVTASWDSTARIWDARTGRVRAILKGHRDRVTTVSFSPDGRSVATGSLDGFFRSWNAVTGQQRTEQRARGAVLSLCFSPAGDQVAIGLSSGIVQIWKWPSAKLARELSGHSNIVSSVAFSPDGALLLSASWDSTFKVWNATSGEVQHSYRANNGRVNSALFSLDGQFVVAAFSAQTAECWSIRYRQRVQQFKGNVSALFSAAFSPDGKRMVTGAANGLIHLWDREKGSRLLTLDTRGGIVFSTCFSPDGTQILSASADGIARTWDIASGQLLRLFSGHRSSIFASAYSPDGTRIATASWDSTLRIWDSHSGQLLREIRGHRDQLFALCFSSDSRKIVSGSADGTAILWDAGSGAELRRFAAGGGPIFSIEFSPDGNRILAACADHTALLWSTRSGALLHRTAPHQGPVFAATFAQHGQVFITASDDKDLKLWSTEGRRLLKTFSGHSGPVLVVKGSPDGNSLLSASADGTARLWDVAKGDMRYLFVPVDSLDHLVVDARGRFDGTAAARQLLYFTCGTEVIALQQVKDRYWVPGLAERINHGDNIAAASVSGAAICGLTPLARRLPGRESYRFLITPRRGGLGRVQVRINNIEFRSYQPHELKKAGASYMLEIGREEVRTYFASDIANRMQVTAYTASNDIAARGVEVHDTLAHASAAPNLHAIFIGVSDYKGEDLHLKYAAKDAADLERALSASAVRLLGASHVFTHRIHTGSDRNAFPDKATIRAAFATIAKSALPNDILLVFFAGHGVVQGTDRQFYFLSADASRSLINDKDIGFVGISTSELVEWMKPAQIKAQKRVLILDACYSGQAINQIVTIGSNEEFLAARNDDRAAEQRQIDRLNERAGLYILAASASNQNAYEMGRYNQGLLTYALLKTLKEQPDILEENKYLNVSGWFNAAQKLVTDLVRESGLRQDPQLITTSNFNIGIVDKEVLSKIMIAPGRALFSASAFINFASSDDELDLTRLLNEQLRLASSQPGSAAITYTTSTNAAESYVLRGSYTVDGDSLTVTVNVKQGKNIRARFEKKGNSTTLPALVKAIVDHTLTLLQANQ